MSLLLAIIGTVLFWVGTVGAVFSAFKLFKPRNIRDKPAMPAWAISLCCVVIAMFGYSLIYVSGVG